MNPTRRRSLGWLAGMLGGTSAAAYADDTLLDPLLIFNDKQKPASSRGSSSDKALVPAYARSMAISVVSSLESLTNAAAERVTDVGRFTKRIAALNTELAALRGKMASTLEEYRQGLFCSGCGKTKSEILSAGQTFPHPGQTVIRATPEQILAKERELQAPIDRDEREQKETEAKRKKAVGEREEALAQIDAGLALWSTSISFESLLIDARESQAETAYKAERAKLEQQLSQANAAKPAASDGAAANAATRRLSDVLSQLNLQWARTVRDSHAARDDAASHSASDQDTLNGYLGRGALQSLNIPAVQAGSTSQTAGFNALGGLYRMGAFDLARSNETLPSVEAFIAEFQHTHAPKGQASPTPQPLDSIRDKLKELMKCDPTVDAGCNKAPRNGGTGLRG